MPKLHSCAIWILSLYYKWIFWLVVVDLNVQPIQKQGKTWLISKLSNITFTYTNTFSLKKLREWWKMEENRLKNKNVMPIFVRQEFNQFHLVNHAGRWHGLVCLACITTRPVSERNSKSPLSQRRSNNSNWHP